MYYYVIFFFFYFLNINLIHLNVESLNIFNSLIYFYIITKSQKDLTIMNTFAEITVKNFQSETMPRTLTMRMTQDYIYQ